MKKIVSFLMTVAMVISTASSVFAADGAYNFAASATEVKPGDVITFTLKLDKNPGMAYFKTLVNFDDDTFARVPYIYEVIEDEEVVEEIEYDVYSTWGSITCNDAQENKTIMVWSNSSNKTSKTVLKINYQVADDAVNGEYDFVVASEEILNAAGGVVDITAGTTTIKVTGGKEPASSHKAAELNVEEKDNKADKAEGEAYTQGFKVTVTPNDDTVNGVDFTLTTSEGKSKPYAGADAFQFDAFTGASSIVLGLNVKEIPATATVDAVFTPVVVAE